MRSEPRQLPPGPEKPIERRYAGWAILLGVLGIGLIVIGVMLVALLQAPFEQSRAVVTGFVLLGLGSALLPVAWLGRRTGGPL